MCSRWNPIVDGVARDYEGKVVVATADVGEPAGQELAERYGSGPGRMAAVYFDRRGQVARLSGTMSESEAHEVLDALLAAN